MDLDKYFNKVIQEYKKSQAEAENPENAGPANLKKLLDSFDKLTVHEKNTLISLFNAMLDDRGQYGGKLWDVI